VERRERQRRYEEHEGTEGTSSWKRGRAICPKGYDPGAEQADGYDYNPVFCSAKSPLFPTYVFGDCTGDGTVNAGDVVFLIGYLYKGGPAPNPYGRGDPNRDCQVNAADIVYLINFLFKNGEEPRKGCD